MSTPGSGPIRNQATGAAREKIVDGIKVDRLRAFEKAVENNPHEAEFTFRASNRWVNGTHSRSTIKDFCVNGQDVTTRAKPLVLDADEPRQLLGEDHGPNATEALLHALGACLNTTFMYYAAKQGVKIDELEIDLEGDIDLRGLLGVSDTVRSGYKTIRVTFRVKAQAPREKVEELCALAQKHSPVFDVVTHATPVVAQVRHV